MRSLFVFCLIVGSSLAAFSQGKTVTNLDLETYKQDRVKAETELRENYAKLGFSSPEERERRNAASAQAAAELSAKLRAERLERERIDADREAAAALSAAYYRSGQPVQAQQYVDPGYFWSNGRRYRLPRRGQYQQPGYFAGGIFITTGPRTPPRPIVIRPHH
ncbi:MAG: hypothetical protein ABJB40_10800 [Acidobacteriota bacterium]